MALPSDILPIYCPACDRTGVSSLMRKGGLKLIGHNQPPGMMYVCIAANHSYPYDRLMALKPRMQKVAFTEKQPEGSLAQPMWIHPEALAGMQRRWPGNWQTTLYSLFNALAHQDSFIVEPEYAVELAAAGVTKGRDVMGLVNERTQLRAQIETLEARLKARPASAAPTLVDPRMDAILAALAGKGIEVNLPAAAPTPTSATSAAAPAEYEPEIWSDGDGNSTDAQGNYIETEWDNPVEHAPPPRRAAGTLPSVAGPGGIPRPSTPMR